jgi:nucleoside-diphosphate-sugar epimerase
MVEFGKDNFGFSSTMKVLVTGSCGFIGTNFVQSLFDGGGFGDLTVYGIDKSSKLNCLFYT